MKEGNESRVACSKCNSLYCYNRIKTGDIVCRICGTITKHSKGTVPSGRLRCPECNTTLVYHRIKTGEMVCKVCGHIFKKEIREEGEKNGFI